MAYLFVQLKHYLHLLKKNLGFLSSMRRRRGGAIGAIIGTALRVLPAILGNLGNAFKKPGGGGMRRRRRRRR